MISGSYLLLEILGAAALLLWGIRMARTSVMRAYGPRIRRLLPGRHSNRFTAFVTGAGAAAVLQSSTAVAVFIASLASLGVVPVRGGLALMLGADLGSAAVAALLALNVKGLWPLLALAGYVVHAAGGDANAKTKQHGRFLLGLGLVMIALTMMGRVSGELGGSATIRFLIASLAGEPILAILVMALLAWIAHSSIAILLLLSSLATTGVVVSPTLIVAAVLGINLGGGLPALFLTWRQEIVARRIILGNALFRLIAAVVGAVLLPAAARLYDILPGAPGVRVVELHVLFNLLLAAVFLIPLGRMEGLLDKLLPAPPAQPESERFGPRYIPAGPAGSAGTVRAPLPLSALTRETLRMSDVILSMLAQTSDLFPLREGYRERIGQIRSLDDRVDTLYKAISSYAIELVQRDLPKSDMSKVTGLLRYSANLENAGDIIDKSLLGIASQKAKNQAEFSEEGNRELSGLFAYILETMQMSAEAVMGWRVDMAELLLERKNEFKIMVNDSSEKHIARLRGRIAGSVETSSFHLGVINDLQRIHTIVVSIATDIVSHRESIGTGD